MFGIASTQAAHEVAQKLTSTTLPRRSEVMKFSPDRVAKRTSGAVEPCRGASAAAAIIATPASAAIIFSFMSRILASFAAAVMLWTSAALGQLERITRQEAVSGLRTALEKGSHAAVAQLGRTDGFFGNPQVKIPLPDALTRTEKMLRRVGMGKYADELVLTMNRAAEAAVPAARPLPADRKAGDGEREPRPQVQRIRRERRRARPGWEAGRRPRRVRDAEGARRPLLHGRRGGEENPQGSGAGRQRHHQEGFRRPALVRLIPVVADADVDQQRDIELRHGLHQLPQLGG